MSKRELSFDAQKRISDALLRIRALQDRHVRDLCLSESDRRLGRSVVAQRDADLTRDVWSLVEVALRHVFHDAKTGAPPKWNGHLRALMQAEPTPRGDVPPQSLIFADVLARRSNGSVVLQLRRWIDAVGGMIRLNRRDCGNSVLTQTAAWRPMKSSSSTVLRIVRYRR